MKRGRPQNFIDLAGKTYGRLTVVEVVDVPGELLWRCRCRCGREHLALGRALRFGRTKSCGCLRYKVDLVEQYRALRRVIRDFQGPFPHGWETLVEPLIRELEESDP